MLYLPYKRGKDEFFQQASARLSSWQEPTYLHRDIHGVVLHRVPSGQPAVLAQQLDGARELQILRFHGAFRARLAYDRDPQQIHNVQD